MTSSPPTATPPTGSEQESRGPDRLRKVVQIIGSRTVALGGAGLFVLLFLAAAGHVPTPEGEASGAGGMGSVASAIALAPGLIGTLALAWPVFAAHRARLRKLERLRDDVRKQYAEIGKAESDADKIEALTAVAGELVRLEGRSLFVDEEEAAELRAMQHSIGFVVLSFVGQITAALWMG